MDAKAIKKKTIKTGKEIVLPGQTEIYQSNRITNGKFKGFTLIQSRVLVYILKQLQEAIKYDMSNKDWKQLDIFNQDARTAKIVIKLKEISKPNQYSEVFSAIEQIMKLSIHIKSTMGNDYEKITNLLDTVETPKKANGESIVIVEIKHEVAKKLIEIDKNIHGQPSHFTKFLYEVAMAASNKYTVKLYMIISSWKSKGGFKTSYKELREKLGISEEEYTEYTDFKRRVLVPIQKDLEKKSDCWFNCKEHGFEVREGKKVVSLSFKIIVPEMVEEVRMRADNIRSMLRLHFKFNDSHIKGLSFILGDTLTKERVNRINAKIIEISEHIRDVRGTKDQVLDIASFMLKSLLNEFAK
jgi:hypothetical protein